MPGVRVLPGESAQIVEFNLPARVREVVRVIAMLEKAWSEGRLSTILDDPGVEAALGMPLVDVYRRLAARGSQAPWRQRAPALTALRAQFEGLHAQPLRWFRATGGAIPLARESAEPTTDMNVAAALLASESPDADVVARAPFEVRTHAGEEEIRLRLDQVITARAWGIAFDLHEPEKNAWLSEKLFHSALRRLTSDIAGLGKIEARFGQREIEGPLAVVADPRGLKFEQLMIDVLNEHERIASRAPLVEDFMEKTDLRVRLPGLNRKHGARVQITQTTAARWHAEKVAEIRGVTEFVFLSPISLAVGILEPAGEPLLDRLELEAFWRAVGEGRGPVPELAAALKDIFFLAIARATEHPLGAAASVPRLVRILVQRFVMAEARRSTAELRLREQRARTRE